jgi:hypothetical protein
MVGIWVEVGGFVGVRDGVSETVAVKASAVAGGEAVPDRGDGVRVAEPGGSRSHPDNRTSANRTTSLRNIPAIITPETCRAVLGMIGHLSLKSQGRCPSDVGPARLKMIVRFITYGVRSE